MEYPEQEKVAHAGLTQALLSGLEMAFEGNEKDPKYGWYNGLLFTLEPITVEQAGKSAIPGGSTIAGHADHILISLEMVLAMFNGQEYQADWGRSWHQTPFTQPTEADWAALMAKLHEHYRATAELIRNKEFWRQEGLSQMIHHVAHTAYHASAIRQILKSVG